MLQRTFSYSLFMFIIGAPFAMASDKQPVSAWTAVEEIKKTPARKKATQPSAWAEEVQAEETTVEQKMQIVLLHPCRIELKN